MYTTKYWIEGINSEDEGNVKSYLEANFKFGRETAPRNKIKVKSRIKNKNPFGLKSYLSEKGFGIIESGPLSQKYIHMNNSREININEHFFTLGFDFYMNVKGEVPRKELFDLDSLNDFILTGEIK